MRASMKNKLFDKMFWTSLVAGLALVLVPFTLVAILIYATIWGGFWAGLGALAFIAWLAASTLFYKGM